MDEKNNSESNGIKNGKNKINIHFSDIKWWFGKKFTTFLFRFENYLNVFLDKKIFKISENTISD